jgi:putative transcriptional regulator
MKRFAPRLVALFGLTLLLLSAQLRGQMTDEPATGKLLVAREDMRDPNFERSVVLLVAYGDTGAMGVVLNRQSHMHLDHLLPHLEDSPALDQPVFLGGPVATRQATILFSSDEPDGRARILENVYVTGDLRLLERLVTNPRPKEEYRVYAGHAGWAPGQLDAEMLRFGWHIFPADAAMIFGDTENLWETLIRRTRSRMANAQPGPSPSRGAR